MTDFTFNKFSKFLSYKDASGDFVFVPLEVYSLFISDSFVFDSHTKLDKIEYLNLLREIQVFQSSFLRDWNYHIDLFNINLCFLKTREQLRFILLSSKLSTMETTKSLEALLLYVENSINSLTNIKYTFQMYFSNVKNLQDRLSKYLVNNLSINTLKVVHEQCAMVLDQLLNAFSYKIPFTMNYKYVVSLDIFKPSIFLLSKDSSFYYGIHNLFFTIDIPYVFSSLSYLKELILITKGNLSECYPMIFIHNISFFDTLFFVFDNSVSITSSNLNYSLFASNVSFLISIPLDTFLIFFDLLKKNNNIILLEYYYHLFFLCFKYLPYFWSASMSLDNINSSFLLHNSLYISLYFLDCFIRYHTKVGTELKQSLFELRNTSSVLFPRKDEINTLLVQIKNDFILPLEPYMSNNLQLFQVILEIEQFNSIFDAFDPLFTDIKQNLLYIELPFEIKEALELFRYIFFFKKNQLNSCFTFSELLSKEDNSIDTLLSIACLNIPSLDKDVFKSIVLSNKNNLICSHDIMQRLTYFLSLFESILNEFK